jgi:VPS13, central RBG modules/Vacuolar-sorting-associated 13 protein, DH-like domain/VPS13-like, N-terminal/Vacuolar-sorting associated protein 13, adaptor binding domain/Vacuolar sorting-associated protein 13, extended-chorein/C2 domain/ATG2/VPS13, C terminal domain
MFEGLVSGLLTTYLGEFVEGVTKDDLNISIFSGIVQLDNLEVKTAALDFLELPFAVKRGFIGKIDIRLSWHKLTSQPVHVTIDRVFIIAGPKDPNHHIDPQEAVRRLLATKLDALQSWENMMFPTQDAGAEPGTAARVAATIINNLHVSIKNVHVRYEDDSTSNPFCAGLLLNEVGVVPTNDSGDVLADIPADLDTVRRKLALDGLAVYLNPRDASIGNTAQLQDALLPEAKQQHEWNYIVPPMHIEISAEQRTTSVVGVNGHVLPSLRLGVDIDRLAAEISGPQYHDIMRILARIAEAGAAANATPEDKKEIDQDAMARDRDRYIELYKCSFAGYGKMEEKQTNALKELEKKLDFADIIRFRRWAIHVASKELNVEPDTLQLRRNQKPGWFGGWFGSKRDPQPISLPDYQIIINHEPSKHEQDTDLEDKSLVKSEFVVKLNQTYVSLRAADGSNVLRSTLNTISTHVKMRPNGMLVSVSVQEVSLKSGLVSRTQYPFLVRSSGLGEGQSTGTPYVQVEFETNPIDDEHAGVDSRTAVTMQPVEVVYHQQVIGAITEFFQPPKSLDTASLATVASAQMRALQTATYAQLESMYEHRGKNALSLSVQAPTVLVPTDCTDPDADVLVVNLGAFEASTKLHDETENPNAVEWLSKLENSDDMDIDHKSEHLSWFYDIYAVHGTDISACFVNGGKYWRRRLAHVGDMGTVTKFGTPHHAQYLLHPLQFTVDVGVCIVKQQTVLPPIRVSGDFGETRFDISPIRYARLMHVISECFTAPAATNTDAIAPQTSVAVGADNTNMESKTDTDRHAAETAAATATSSDLPSRSQSFWSSIRVSSLIVTALHDAPDGKYAASAHQIIKINVNHIATTVCVRTNDMRVAVSVADMNVLDGAAVSKGYASEFQSIISTSPYSASADAKQDAGQSFFSVEYTSMNAKSPYYKSAFSTVHGKMGTLFLNVNRETLSTMAIFFMYDLLSLPVFNESLQSGSVSTAARQLNGAEAAAAVTVEGPKIEHTPTAPSQETMNITFSFVGLHVHLSSDQHSVSRLTMRGVETSFSTFKSGDIGFELGMQEIVLLDLTEQDANGLYTEVITTSTVVQRQLRSSSTILSPHAAASAAAASESDTDNDSKAASGLLSMSYRTSSVILDQEYMTVDTHPGSYVHVELGHLRVVFLMRFVQELTNFPGELLHNLKAQADKHEEAQRQLMASSLEPMTYTEIDSTDTDNNAVPPLDIAKAKHMQMQEAKSNTADHDSPKVTAVQHVPPVFMHLEVAMRHIEIVAPKTSASSEQLLAHVSHATIRNRLIEPHSLFAQFSALSDTPDEKPRTMVRLPSEIAASLGSSLPTGGSLYVPPPRVGSSARSKPRSIPKSTPGSVPSDDSDEEFFDVDSYHPTIFQQFTVEVSSVILECIVQRDNVVVGSGHRRNESASTRQVSESKLHLMSLPGVSVMFGQKLQEGDVDDGVEPEHSDTVLDCVFDAISVLISSYQSELLGALFAPNGNLNEPPRVIKPYEPPSRVHWRNARIKSLAVQRFKHHVDTARSIDTARTARSALPPPSSQRSQRQSPRFFTPRSPGAAHPRSAGIDMKHAGANPRDPHFAALSNLSPHAAELPTTKFLTQVDHTIEEAEQDLTEFADPLSHRTMPEEEPSHSSIKARVVMGSVTAQVVRDPFGDQSSALVLCMSLGAAYSQAADGDLATVLQANDIKVIHSDVQREERIDGLLQVIDNVMKNDPSSVILEPLNSSIMIRRSESHLQRSATQAESKHAESGAGLPSHAAEKSNASSQSSYLRCITRVSPVNMRFTYLTYRLITDSVNALAAGATSAVKHEPPVQQESAAPTAAILPFEAAESLDPVLVEDYVVHTAAAALDSNSSAGHESETQSALPTFGEQDFDITIDSVHVQLVNDAAGFGIPLALVDIPKLGAHLDAFEQKRTLLAEVELAAKFYNSAVDTWEPLIEPWALSVTVNQSIEGTGRSTEAHGISQADNHTLTTVSVDSNHVFNANFSRSMIDGITQSLDLLTATAAAAAVNEETKAESSKYTGELECAVGAPPFSPYRLQNHTELPVVFHATKMHGDTALQKHCDQKLGAMQHCPVEFVSDNSRAATDRVQDSKAEVKGSLPSSLSTSLGDASRNPLHMVSVEFGGFQALRDVSLDTVSTSIFALLKTDGAADAIADSDAKSPGPKAEEFTAKDQDGALYDWLGNPSPDRPIVMVESCLRQGMKVLSVHSTFAVRNETAFPIVMYGRELSPGASMWVPLIDACEPTFTVKPIVDGTNFGESEAIVLHSAQPRDSAVQCVAQDSSEEFHLCVELSIKFLQDSATLQQFRQTTIVLRAPLLIENLLAEDAHFRVLVHESDGKRQSKERAMNVAHAKRLTSLFVPMGKRAFSHAASPTQCIALSIHVPALNDDEWSDLVPLSADKKSHKDDDSRIVLQNDTRVIPLHCRNGYTFNAHMDVLEFDADGEGNEDSDVPRPQHVTVYAPVWVFDTTALALQFSDCKDEQYIQTPPHSHAVVRSTRTIDVFDEKDSNGLTSNDFKSGKQDFAAWPRRAVMLSGKSTENRKFTKLFVRGQAPQSSSWSESVAIGSAGTTGMTSFKNRDGKLFELGYSVHTASGRFHRTRIVTFSPLLMIANQFPTPIQVRQFQDLSTDSGFAAPPMLLQPGQVRPFFWPSADQHKFLAFRLVPNSNMDAATLQKKVHAFARRRHQEARGDQEAAMELLGINVDSNNDGIEDVMDVVITNSDGQPTIATDVAQVIFDNDNDDDDGGGDGNAGDGALDQKHSSGGDSDDEESDADSQISPILHCGSEWTGYFHIHKAEEFPLMVRQGSVLSNMHVKDSFIARVEVRTAGSNLSVSLKPDDTKCPPFRVENRTSIDVFRFYQTGCSSNAQVLDPFRSVPFAWDDLTETGEHLLLTISIEGDKKQERNFRIDKAKNFKPILLHHPQRTLYAYVRAIGPTKVFVLSDLPNPKSGSTLSLRERSMVIRLRYDELAERRQALLDQRQYLKEAVASVDNSVDESSSRLIIDVIEAKQLTAANFSKSSDPYVKVAVLTECHETPVMRDTLNPLWRSRMVFSVPHLHRIVSSEEIVKVAVFSKNRIFSDAFLGGIKLSDLYTKLRINDARLKYRADNPDIDDSDAFAWEGWHKLHHYRQNSNLSGSIRLRIQWIENESMLLKQDICRAEDKLVQVTLLMGIIERFHGAKLRRVTSNEVARLRFHKRGLFDSCFPRSLSVVSENGVESEIDSDASEISHIDTDEDTMEALAVASKQNRVVISIEDVALSMSNLLEKLPARTSVKGAGRVVAIARCGHRRSMHVLYKKDIATGRYESAVDESDHPLLVYHIEPDELKRTRVELMLFLHELSEDEISEASHRDAAALRAQDKYHYSFIGRVSIPLRDAKLFDDDNNVVAESKSHEANDGKQHQDDLERQELHNGVWFPVLPLAAHDSNSVLVSQSSRVTVSSSGNSSSNINRLITGVDDGQVFVRVRRLYDPPAQFRPRLKLMAQVPQVGLSLIDNDPEEVFYLSVDGTTFAMEDSPAKRTLQFQIFKFQLDNQLLRPEFDIILAARPVRADKQRALIQVDVNLQKAEAVPNVQVFTFASVHVGDMELKVEEALIWHTLAYVNGLTSTGVDTSSSPIVTGTTDATVDDVDAQLAIMEHASATFGVESASTGNGSSSGAAGAGTAGASSGPDKLYFSHLQLALGTIHISFSANPALRARFSRLSWNPLSMVLGVANTAGVVLTSIESLPLELGPLTITDAFGDYTTLLQPILEHYQHTAITQAYKVFGSLEILGDPIGLVNNVGSGLQDLFIEPAQGLASGNVEDVGRGVIRGTGSLLRSTAIGVFSAGANITSGIGKGVSVFVSDEYNAERQRDMRVDGQPTHLGTGVASGAKNFAKGIFAGVTGIVVDPFKGAKRDGVKGFFKGFVSGVTGVVTKPVLGAVDMANKTLLGVRNTVVMLEDKPVNVRARLPRFIPLGGPVLEYDADAALGRHILFKVEPRAFSDTWEEAAEFDYEKHIGEQYLFCLKFEEVHGDENDADMKYSDSDDGDSDGNAGAKVNKIAGLLVVSNRRLVYVRRDAQGEPASGKYLQRVIKRAEHASKLNPASTHDDNKELVREASLIRASKINKNLVERVADNMLGNNTFAKSVFWQVMLPEISGINSDGRMLSVHLHPTKNDKGVSRTLYVLTETADRATYAAARIRSKFSQAGTVIVRAEYGLGMSMIDVTEQLQRYIDEQPFLVASGSVKYNTIAGRDPIKGVVKVLTITYRRGNMLKEMTLKENDPIMLV